MTQEEFNVVFELQMRKCADILAHKKKEYTGDNIDRLSAFKILQRITELRSKSSTGRYDVETCRIPLRYVLFHSVTF